MAEPFVKTFEDSYSRYVSNVGNVSISMQLTMKRTYDSNTGTSTLQFYDFKLKQSGVSNSTTYVYGTITVTVNGTVHTIFSNSASGYYKISMSSNYSSVQGKSSSSAWSYTLNNIEHTLDGSLQVVGTWTDITVSNYLNGYNVKVSGTETVDLDKIPKQYSLSINAGPNSSITVNRTSSPNGGASTGVITNGATIYYGDILKISFSANPGYKLITQTVNGSTFNSGSTHTVTANVTVISEAEILGVIRFFNGTEVEMYIWYYDTGAKIEQYILVYDTGTKIVYFG